MSEIIGRVGDVVRSALTRIDRRENGTARILLLPQNGDSTAEQYATHLKISELREPLGKFLQTVSVIPGLDGIGLAVWRWNSDPKLWIYDFSDLSKTGTPENPSVYSMVSQAYDDLFVTTRDFTQSKPFIRSSLNTKFKTFEEYAKIFPNKLPHDFLTGMKMEPATHASLATLLKISSPKTMGVPILDDVEQRLYVTPRADSMKE